MNRSAFKLMLIVPLLFALVALPATRAVADDETDGVEFKVEAPLEGSNCEGTPATITLLGLTIDVSNAAFQGGSKMDMGAGTCADLIVRQMVEVKLANDIPDATSGFFMALKVEAGSEMAEDEDMEELEADEVAEIDARIQEFDAVANTLTVLGLTFDISQAKIEGLKDQDDEAEVDDDVDDDVVDPSQLAVGQFVEVKLTSAISPISANEVDVKNFENKIEVKLLDEDGEEEEDGA